MDIKYEMNKIEEVDLIPKTKSGILVADMDEKKYVLDHDVFVPHREAHYLLMVITRGYIRGILDFEEVVLRAPCIFLMAPGQVHQVTELGPRSGFNIKFDPAIISTSLNNIFGKNGRQYFHITNNDELFQQAFTTSSLMYKLQANEGSYQAQSSRLLLESLLNMVAHSSIAHNKEAYNKTLCAGEMTSAAWTIEKKFRGFLHDYYKQWKSPSLYASAMNVSLPHLNDTIKRLTGYCISVHIQRKSIVEAKRLLHFTSLSIKEVGYETGYDDPAYFSRLFKKIAGLTPHEFRQQFLD